MEDMATAGRFAQQAAVAIAQSAVSHDLTSLLRAALAGLDRHDGSLLGRAAAVAAQTSGRAEFGEMIEIAATLGAIGREGEAARALCGEIVGALDRYLRAQRGMDGRQYAAGGLTQPAAAMRAPAEGGR